MSSYDTLNEPQKEAVFTTEGPVLILAGAGSGKTRALTHRIAYLIDEIGVSPFNIMAITFTNKAAGEMKERVEDLVGLGSDAIWVTTFHSSCVRILRRFADKIGYDNNFSIYDSDDSKSLMKEVCKKLNIDTKQLKERTILAEISSAKDELITAGQYRLKAQGDFRKAKMAEAYQMYQDALVKNNAMDFDDLIMNTVELLKTNPDVLNDYQKRFKYIMVDEYQDTNTAQFQLIRLLAGGYKNLCVVGDDDQSIYKFRGANIRNILDFEKYYPEAKVIRLEQNYRSTQNILSAANAVIANNEGRKDKKLWTDKGSGNLIHLRMFDTAYEEAEFIASDVARKARQGQINYGDCAVLYRTNAQSRLLEEKFVYEGIPYNVVGGVNFYSRREIKDILAYLKTIDNGRDDLTVRRIINVPKRGIGATSIAKISSFAQINDMSFFDACAKASTIPGMGKSAAKIEGFVNIITVLRAKAQIISLSELVRELLESTSYIQEFDADSEEDAQNRIDNIEELINKVIAYEQEHEEANLSQFLEEVALVADIDEVDSSVPRALLMTLHSAKGLEFSNVYLAGMEDGLFPSYMTVSSDNPDEIEEERRLAYVGITRAKDDLTLCYSRSRMIRGEMQYNAVSRFVKEIPKELMDNRPPKPRIDEYSEPTVSYSPLGRPKAVATKKVATSVCNVGGLSSLDIAGISKGVAGVEKAVAGEKPDYDIGSRVSHVKFGEGTVTDIEPGPRDFKVTVDFDEVGTKIMYAAFARLKKID